MPCAIVQHSPLTRIKPGLTHAVYCYPTTAGMKRPSPRSLATYNEGLSTLLYNLRDVYVVSTQPPIVLPHAVLIYPTPATPPYLDLTEVRQYGRYRYIALTDPEALRQIMDQYNAIMYIAYSTEALATILDLTRFQLQGTEYYNWIHPHETEETFKAIFENPDYLVIHANTRAGPRNYLAKWFEAIDIYYMKFGWIDVFITNNPGPIPQTLQTWATDIGDLFTHIDIPALAYLTVTELYIRAATSIGQSTWATNLREYTDKYSALMMAISKIMQCLAENLETIRQTARTITCGRNLNARTVIRQLYEVRRLIEENKINEALGKIQALINTWSRI
mgnify:CR=1 FL=1